MSQQSAYQTQKEFKRGNAISFAREGFNNGRKGIFAGYPRHDFEWDFDVPLKLR